MTAPTRPVLRYHGGKWKLAPWILSFFPPHRVYVEPFGGAASVLLRKERSYAEVYNDLDGEVVNVFRVMRDPLSSVRLRELLELTPFAREEFERAYDRCTEPVEQARRTIIKSFFGFGSASIHGRGPACGMRTRPSTWHTTGFRANSNRSGTTPAHDWASYPALISEFCSRLRRVVIERRDAARVIGQHDTTETLLFVDPPYVLAARTRGNEYAHEMTDEQHEELLAQLMRVRGMVVLSGYASEMYDRSLAGWERHETAHMADGARPRTEVVWLNPACVRALRESRAQTEAFA